MNSEKRPEAVAWRTATGEDGPELFEHSGPEPPAEPSAATGIAPEATPRPSDAKRRSDARMKENRRRGTAVVKAIKNLWVIAAVTHGPIDVSPVVKDLKRS
jgi:hypothetical protein